MTDIGKMWSRMKAVLLGLTVLALGAWQPACACAHDHHSSAAQAAHNHAPSATTEHDASASHNHEAPAHHADVAIESAAQGCATEAPLCDHSDKPVVTAKVSAGDGGQTFAKSPAPSAVIVHRATVSDVYRLAGTQTTIPRLRPPPLPTPITLKVRQLA